MSGGVVVEVATPEDMRLLGMQIGQAARAGDVVVLSGPLGAGKTTVTQGIARGLGITEQVTSPTFVIARVHRNHTGRPDLIHVDAYRLGSVAELEDLEIDADLPLSVMVVEWGAGLVEAIVERPLYVEIVRSDDEELEVRRVELRSDDERWIGQVADRVRL